LPNRFNIEVFYTVPEMYLIKLFTCIECGELFVIDFENPAFAGKSAEEIAGNVRCPQCGRLLRETIRPYPENFRVDEQVGHFAPDRSIPPDSESMVKEILELE
jgi:DNA-directed RNA polymerase subunit RPC12/RpoP